MAPNANEPAVKPDVLSDEFGFQPEDIVVTGFSGRMPECDSIDELRTKLYAGEDMVNANPTRWPDGKWSLLLTLAIRTDINVVRSFAFDSDSDRIIITRRLIESAQRVLGFSNAFGLKPC
jgi:hypothetical protein